MDSEFINWFGQFQKQELINDRPFIQTHFLLLIVLEEIASHAHYLNLFLANQLGSLSVFWKGSELTWELRALAQQI